MKFFGGPLKYNEFIIDISEGKVLVETTGYFDEIRHLTGFTYYRRPKKRRVIHLATTTRPSH